MTQQTPIAIAECSNCGQKNRMPATVARGFKVQCGKCHTALTDDDLIDDEDLDDVDDED